MGGTGFVTLEQAAGMVRPGARVLMGAAAGEPAALIGLLRQEPELWQDVRLTGAFLPGVNDADFTALGTGTRVETIFATPGLRAPLAEGRAAHLPLHYSGFWQRLARPGIVDAVVVTVPPPRPDGTVGLGVVADFAPAAIAAGARLIGIVNPAMPDVAEGPRFPADRFAALAEGPAPLPVQDDGAPDPALDVIAGHVLGLLRPGDTLQVGIGSLAAALLRRLPETGVRGLRLHSGLVPGPILPLLEGGLFPGGVTAGVALGPAGFAAAIAARRDVRFAPVGHTHALAVLAGLPGLLAVNAALEVDLAGQANAESLGGRQVSGQGGLVDFLRGARAAPGGRAVLALRATARGGSISRIVARLGPGTQVSVARGDIDFVATEYGLADLREASLAQRAERMAAIAAPAFRDRLFDDWARGPGASG